MDHKNEKLKDILSGVIDFSLTNKYMSDYNYGLHEQITDLNIYESVKWIMSDMYYKNYFSHSSHHTKPHGSCLVVDMDYIEPYSVEGVHRAGWKYVTDALYEKYHQDNAPVLLDTCIDATFHWNYQILLLKDKIPYKKPWIGIIHHTPDEEYTCYNTTNLLKNEKFIESLCNCVCIIVLSNFLKKWVDKEFKKMGIHVKVIFLTHPTEFVDETFSTDKFLLNTNRMVVQIGGWMRDSYAIYALQPNIKKLQIKKAFLRGKMMENYFKPIDFDVEKLVEKYEHDREHTDNCAIQSQTLSGPNIFDTAKNLDSGPSHDPSCGVNRNKFISGMLEHLKNNYKSVKEISRLSNNNYDKLLTQNIVFLNLKEASACNTLIECVVRNTPIVINRHSAIEEILGTKYPLFYDTLKEANEMVTSIKLIADAFIYLTKLDKTKLKIETFLNDFEREVL